MLLTNGATYQLSPACQHTVLAALCIVGNITGHAITCCGSYVAHTACCAQVLSAVAFMAYDLPLALVHDMGCPLALTLFSSAANVPHADNFNDTAAACTDTSTACCAVW